jgi:hypothetical protein
MDFGSVALPAAFAKTPALKEASVDESVVLTAFCVMGFVAEMEICGTRRARYDVLWSISKSGISQGMHKSYRFTP